jgi:hypothetical protein
MYTGNFDASFVSILCGELDPLLIATVSTLTQRGYVIVIVLRARAWR